MWQLLAGQIDADQSRIDTLAGKARETAIGSVSLGELDAVPEYQHRVPIHGQPGGYMLDRSPDDLGAGLLYEAGGNIYALGQGIGKRDSKGERLIAYVRERFPALRVRRILEMGCSAGDRSIAWTSASGNAAG